MEYSLGSSAQNLERRTKIATFEKTPDTKMHLHSLSEFIPSGLSLKPGSMWSIKERATQTEVR